MLNQADTQGFIVRSVPAEETMDAIDVRGALEAVAIRMLAERRQSRSLMQSLHTCLRQGDAIFAKGHLVASDAAEYDAMNEQFHALIVQGAGSKVVADAVKRNNRIPFAAAHTVAFGRRDIVRAYDSLNYLHRQHHEIVRALENREGTRVMALMLEHAYEAKIRVSMNRSIWRASFEN
jgi:GntR family transcriptional regulator of vanillate catabolism